MTLRGDVLVEEWLESMLKKIRSEELLPAEYFSTLDCDAALDARDKRMFDARWRELYEGVERHWEVIDLGPEIQGLAEDIRREAFLRVSRATGQHEIASYVSDDFDLLVRAYLMGIETDFTKTLWKAYEEGKFPVKAK